MAGQADHSAVVLGSLTRILEAVADGTSARERFCETTAALFACHAVGHALLEPEHHRWSVCLWGHDGSVTVRRRDPALTDDVLGAWWTGSACRRALVEGVRAPCLVEVPLVASLPAHASVLVLGRDRAFDHDDARLAGLVLQYLAVVERVALRLDAAQSEPADLPVTGREQQVLGLLTAGLTARSIASRMDVSERTVHKHLENVYQKLGVHDRLSAVIRAQQLGLLPGGAARRAEPVAAAT